MKRGFGILAIVVGTALVLWIGYNLIQPTQAYEQAGPKRRPFGGIAIGVVMIGWGIKLVRDED